MPDLLTVEEAARFIRVGRTKAYAMAREWRTTGGRSGLPVVDFGHVLRVPRRALERLVEEALAGSATSTGTAEPERLPNPTTSPRPEPSSPPHRRHRSRSTSQLGLFEPPRAS